MSVMETQQESSESALLTNYVGELKSFCSMFSERCSRENNSPYIRVWLAIMQNILSDEEKARRDAVRLLDGILADGENSLSDTSRSSMYSLREYLCVKGPDDSTSSRL